MSGGKYVFLTIDGGAWGRAALGLDIARSLHSRGEQIKIIASQMTAPLARSSSFAVDEMPDTLGAFSQMYVEASIAAEAPTAVVLCDFYSCSMYFRKRRIDPSFLFRVGAPVIALDIWDASQKRTEVDVFGKTRQAFPEQIDDAAGRLVPVPIGRPTAKGGYCSLPKPIRIDQALRDCTRSEFGSSREEKVVLFCTGGWQHQVDDVDGARVANLVPGLIAEFLAKVHPSVRLIHIGPERLPLDTFQDRYCWLPSLAPKEFDRILGSADLMLSCNIAATTIGRAISVGVPVLVVKNSYAASDFHQLEVQTPHFLSPLVKRWLQKAMPLYKFSMWPLGYAAFLEPILSDNAYCSAVDFAELTDEQGFVERCQQLLFEPAGLEDVVRRQTAYIDDVKRLPTARELIDSYIK